MGKPVTERPRTLEERRITAYHEAGHALIAILLSDLCGPLHRVTIVQHEKSGGFTATVPTSSIGNTKEQFIATITVGYGGRAAELLVFNKITTGPVNDMSNATILAKEMIKNYGMSAELGPIILANLNNTSKTELVMEKEIHTILNNAYNAAYKMLSENLEKLDLIAHALLEKETLTARQVYEVLGMPYPVPSMATTVSA